MRFMFVISLIQVLFCSPLWSANESNQPLDVKPITSDKDAAEKNRLINQIQTLSIQGNLIEADKLLAAYKNKYGEDKPWLIERARYLALSGNAKAALEIAEPLLKLDPQNKALNDIHQYALAHPSPSQPSEMPNDKKINLINEIQNASLSANYPVAKEKLTVYEQQYGSDNAYLTEKARYLALTGNAKESLIIVEPLLAADAKNKTLLDIQQYAHDHPNETESMSSTKIDVNTMDEKSVFIRKIQGELIKGDYKDAKTHLNAYQQKYGEDNAYLTEKARYYAFTNNKEKALLIVNKLLIAEPNNKDILDIKNYAITHAEKPIEETKKQPQISPRAVANSLEKSAEYSKNNPFLYCKAAVAYSQVKDNKRALLMINKAVVLDPNNVNFLKLQAEIASASGDLRTAYKAYQRFYQAYRNDPAALLGYARAAGYIGKTDQSNRLYKMYLKRYPNDSTAWLEAAYIENWNGNYSRAIRLLNQYYIRFGSNKAYLIERARILASASRPTESLAIINRLLPTNTTNYDLNYANTVALFYDNRPIEMFDSLTRVNQILPNDPQTLGLNDFIRTPFRSNVNLDVYHSRDSDTVEITKETFFGTYFLTPVTSFIGNVSNETLSATVASGLNPIEGGTTLNLRRLNVGAEHRFNPHFDLRGTIGGANVSDDRNSLIYQVDAFFKFNDITRLIFQSKEDYYDVSARAVSLGVKQNLNMANVMFEPCIQCYLNLNASYSTFTDTNTMQFYSGTLLRNFLATQAFNLNLGVTGQWDGFSQQLNNGYYNPADYRYYALLFQLYIKQSDNIGYTLSMGLGRQKDETFTRFKPANDFAAKGYFGIYKDWYLVLSAGYSTRGRDIGNNPSNDPYHVYALNGTLTYRF